MRFITDQGTVFIRPFTNSALEVCFMPDGSLPADSSYAVNLKPGAVDIRSEVVTGGVVYVVGDLGVRVTENPFSLTFIYKGDTVLRDADGFIVKPGLSSVSFALAPDEQIFGAGERAIPLNRRGYELPLYNKPNYGYGMGVTSLNYSIPLILSSKKYALLWDNPQSGSVDIGKADTNIMTWRAIGGTARYFIMAADNYPDLMETYTTLTGRQSLPPRWALGNLQSRMAYRTQAETDSIMNLMLSNDFPVDAVILDFYWFGDSIKGYVGNLDWYRKNWPEPEKMIADFKKKGIKTILITEPYVIDSLKNYSDGLAHNIFVTDSLGKPYLDTNFYFGHGSLIDIFKPEARDWFWKRYQQQIEKGVAGWWGDLGEPESHPSDIYHVIGKADEVHGIYGHYWDRMVFEKYARYYPRTRLFHLQRSGYAGSQRYSAYPWTGDVGRSWSGLKAQLPVLLSMSMNGLGYIHSDAGGFALGVKDDDLYTRWLQFAAFTPVMRPHGSGIPSEPVYFSEETQNVVRDFMKLRYSLLPYNYTLAWQNTVKGYPLMRPLFYAYPDDTTAVAVNDEYLWGDELLIAPVLDSGAVFRKLYLPEGEWYDYFTGKRYPGKQWVELAVTRKTIPIFAREGAFIPATNPVKSTDFYRSDNFNVRYYPKGNSGFTQYEDDGLNNQALIENEYELIHYRGSTDEGKTTLTITREGSWDGMPEIRAMTIEIKAESAPRLVQLNQLPLKSGKRNMKGFWFEDGFIKVRFDWDGSPVNIVVN